MYFRLKCELLCYGIVLTDEARAALPAFRNGAVTVKDFPTTSGLILRLPEDRYVNARVDFHESAFLLDRTDVGFHLVVGNERVPVEVHGPADYAIRNHQLPGYKSIRAVANTHADRVRLTPIHGCAAHCQFCNFPGMAYRKNAIDELQLALTIALGDRIIQPPHVLISGGTPKREEADYLYLNEVYRELPACFPDLRFDVMLSPRTLNVGVPIDQGYPEFTRFLKDSGYEAISVNLEFNNSDVLRRYAAEKAAIGRDNYLRFMEHAVEAFGPGAVRSVLIVGIEDDTETLKAVEALAGRGVLVELSPFNAFPGTFLGSYPEATPDRLEALFERARVIAERQGAPLGYFCVRCGHNIL